MPQESIKRKIAEEIMGIIDEFAYFVSTLFGVYSHAWYPIELLIDVATQPNLIAKSFLPEHCTARSQAAGNLQIRSSSKYCPDVIGQITLHVRIGGSLPQATLHFDEKLAVNILLGTSSIDEYILGILPQSKKVLPCNS